MIHSQECPRRLSSRIDGLHPSERSESVIDWRLVPPVILPEEKLPVMKSVVWGLVLLLVIVHQDIWFWNNDRLVFGFLPMTLAWHAGISIAASITWLLAIQFAWPEGLDDESIAASADPGDPEPQEGGAA